MTLYFATSSTSKVEEARIILGIPVEPVSIELEEIQDLDLGKIIRHKARQAYEKIKKPVLVDDVGLYIDAWNGFPGPFIKFIRLAGGNKLLLRMMQQETNRKAVVKLMIGFHDGKEIHIFKGIVEGRIATEERGTNNWGFDPVFIPSGSDKTFAQMTIKEKSSISHRKKALDAFKGFLMIHTVP